MKIVLALSRPDMVTILNTARDGHGGTATPAAAARYHKRLLEICKRIVEQSDQRHCVVCGCTDNLACPGGCSWVMIHRKTPTGVCSKCWGVFIRQVDESDMDKPC